MNDAAATILMVASGTTVASQLPAAAAIRWLAMVATRTPHMTVCQRNLVAKAIASNWVLSPISARTTKASDARNAVMRSILPG